MVTPSSIRIALPAGDSQNLAQRRRLGAQYQLARRVAITQSRRRIQFGSPRYQHSKLCSDSEPVCVRVWVSVCWLPAFWPFCSYFILYLFGASFAILLPALCVTFQRAASLLGALNPLLRVYLYAKYVNLRPTATVTWRRGEQQQGQWQIRLVLSFMQSTAYFGGRVCLDLQVRWRCFRERWVWQGEKWKRSKGQGTMGAKVREVRECSWTLFLPPSRQFQMKWNSCPTII